MTQITKFSESRHSKLETVGISRVKLDNSLLKQRRDVNHASLHIQHEECKRTGRIDNFKISAGLKKGMITTMLAADSDLYKWIEACAYSLSSYDDLELKAKVDFVIDLVCRGQEKDGYINTSYSSKPERWKDLLHGHELYCGGHLIQAAIAYYRAAGEQALLDAAVKWAEHICDHFGPSAHKGIPGHPGIEMALVELYRETRRVKYLNLAAYFIENRGKNILNNDMQFQDHLPVRKQTTVEGHAVRQLYLASGIADIYAETGEEAFLEALQKQWRDFTHKKMAVTGGAGARYDGEKFGLEYEIPNRTGYYETCASIASYMWSWRMLQVTGEAKYADIMEQVLYNGILSGVSLDGLRYFYTNPLEHYGGEDIGECFRGSNRRTAGHWEHTACCPPNVARLLASIPGYIYGTSEGAVYIHHYVSSKAEFKVQGQKINIAQDTDYPWDGSIKIKIHVEKHIKFPVMFRIPGWAKNSKIRINGKIFGRRPVPGSYSNVTRIWSPGDRIELDFAMPVEKTMAHPRVTENNGKVAIKRGPIVYCLESADHPGLDIFNISLSGCKRFTSEYRKDLLGGITVIRVEGKLFEFPDKLYAHHDKAKNIGGTEILAVPYFSWANREPGAMRVWLPDHQGHNGL